MVDAGRTQGDIKRHNQDHGEELTRSTISRMVNSTVRPDRPRPEP